MEQKSSDNRQILLLEIDKKRKKMVMTAMNMGLSSEETVRCSQELDQLLNQYERMKIQHSKTSNFPKLFLRNFLLYFIGYTTLKTKKVING